VIKWHAPQWLTELCIIHIPVNKYYAQQSISHYSSIHDTTAYFCPYCLQIHLTVQKTTEGKRTMIKCSLNNSAIQKWPCLCHRVLKTWQTALKASDAVLLRFTRWRIHSFCDTVNIGHIWPLFGVRVDACINQLTHLQENRHL